MTATVKRTVRRCTALVLVVLAVVSIQIEGTTRTPAATFVALPALLGAACYLSGSLLVAAAFPPGSEEDHPAED